MPARVSASAVSRGLLPGRRWLTYDDAAFALGYGRTRIYELVQRGDLLAVGEGKARRITSESIRVYAQRVEDAARKERGIA